jgi:hypothetical protein
LIIMQRHGAFAWIMLIPLWVLGLRADLLLWQTILILTGLSWGTCLYVLYDKTIKMSPVGLRSRIL